MENTLSQIESTALKTLNTIDSTSALDQLKSQLLGKQSPITAVLKKIPSLPIEKRSIIGKLANTIKQKLTRAIQDKYTEIENEKLSQQLNQTTTDTSLPPSAIPIGTLHPFNHVIAEITYIFTRLGFTVKEGPDIESEDYNFDKLNIPKNHPARDMHDTFFINNDTVLRTHTSPVQIRTMLAEKPPIRILAPGKVYRCDADTSHSPVFHQIEGLYVDTHVSFADLKGTLTFFLHELFGPSKKVRFRPSYFPFTEPSAEIDVECVQCNGTGCRLCKQTGWLEILGAGLVNRNVFRAVNNDPNQWTGFAFGMGIERIAMLKYKIPDIRLFYENNVQFLSQF
jgi:phenylalanyl-tRNA synthetase alpha chain